MIISSRTSSTWAFLLASLSLNALAQEPRLPAFDSFSYLQDSPLRSGYVSKAVAPADTVECVVPQAPPQPKPEPVVVVNECPQVSDEQALSQKERFELQLALDKALSQILKLTVDYEALRVRVQSMGSFSTDDQTGFQQNRGELQAMVELHAKQTADRDRQLSVLQKRLESAQSRYDRENVSRLVAEKKLKSALSKEIADQETVADSNKKLDLLTRQLEEHKADILQLESELKIEKSAMATHHLPLQVGSVQDGPAGSQFNVTTEWIIDGLRFKQGSAEIESGSTQNLKVLVSHLKQNPELSIQINGYTDSVGSVESNLRLSQARAESVGDYLTGQGIVFYRIKALGYGERRSLGDNGTEQGRQQNRRVAVLFLK